ncbi:MAG: hypothetical protein ACK5QW_05965 [Cyanobacteriota bacterium]|jgi:hypothetical protein
MALLGMLILLVLTVSHWLFEPLLRVSVPLLSSLWLGWILLAGALWCLAGSSSDEPPAGPLA